MVRDHGAPKVNEMCRALFDDGEAHGRPLRMIEIRFRYEEGVWGSEISVETIADYHETVGLRATFDARAAELLRGLWEEDYDRLIFRSRKHYPIQDPGILIAISPFRGRLTPEVPDALAALERELHALYEGRGRRLYCFSWRIRGPEAELDEDRGMYNTYYG